MQPPLQARLIQEEQRLGSFLEGQGLRDLACQVPNHLRLHQVPRAMAYASRYRLQREEMMEQVAHIYYHLGGASRLDRAWAGPGWEPESCEVVLSPWSDHGMLSFQLRVGDNSLQAVHQEAGASSLCRAARWRLNAKTLRQPESCDMIAGALGAWRERLAKKESRGELLTVATEWEEAKREVARVCQKAARRAHRTELAEYHQAVSGFLRAHVALNEGRVYKAEKLRRDEAVIQAFLQKKRE